MKTIILTVLLAIPGIGAFAQITLTSGSYPSSILGTDSLKVTTSSSVFPSLSAMADGIWDLSTVTDSTPVFYAYRVATSPYQFADSDYFSLSTYSYQGNVQSSIISSGLFDYEMDVKRKAYSLLALTTDTADSLIINQQNISYSNPNIVVAFPATYSSSWFSSYQYDFGFQLSYTIIGFNHSPGFIRRYITERDTVIGWGKMRIKDITGSPSGYHQVLQVQSTTETTDSIFINGVTASPAILLPLGLTQGKTDTAYKQNYYRMQEVTPLASIDFRDAAYTQPYRATTHVQRLQSVGITGVPGNSSLLVYPNPVNDGHFSVTLPYEGSWSYRITDIEGHISGHGNFAVPQGADVIYLPATITTGVYNLGIYNGNSLISSRLLSVQSR